MNQLTVSNIELNFFKGYYNIIDCGIRTGKTYWAVNNLKQFSRDSRLDRVLFLVDTNSLKESILAEYGDSCCEADTWWDARSTWGEHQDKIGIMCYQALGMRALRNDLSFLQEIDCICWDECDSIFDFAAKHSQRPAKRTSPAKIQLTKKYSL